jgi:ABC-type transport system involved in cytochrome bd biosynthesis fused ATPase/permease subunit
MIILILGVVFAVVALVMLILAGFDIWVEVEIGLFVGVLLLFMSLIFIGAGSEAVFNKSCECSSTTIKIDC